MNKKGNVQMIIAVVVVVVLALISFLLYFNRDSNKAAEQTTISLPSEETLEDNVVETNSDNLTENGRYIEYSSPNSLAKANKARVLFFYANWCPTCRPVDQEIKARSKELPENLTIIRVNYNDTDTDENEKALAEKYAVTYQHTFVVLQENGEILKIWNGSGLDRILKEI